jgi:hypothetical protein
MHYDVTSHALHWPVNRVIGLQRDLQFNYWLNQFGKLTHHCYLQNGKQQKVQH